MDEKSSYENLALSDCVCFNLRRAARLVTRAYDDALRPSGLRATQFSILAVLAHAGTLNMSALAGALSTERTTLSRNLKHLSGKGLVDVTKGKDLRTRRVSITKRGREALNRAIPGWRKAQEETLEALGTPEWAGLLGGVRRILRPPGVKRAIQAHIK